MYGCLVLKVMKFLCWNCQGLGNTLAVQALRAILAQDRPDLICLMETKNQEEYVQKIRKRLKFQHSFVVNPRGIAGGIAMMWSDTAKIQINLATDNFIDTIYEDVDANQKFRITFVHAPTNYQEKLFLWSQLQELNNQHFLPWVCWGDFNEILYFWEKVGKREAENYRMNSFRNFLNDSKLMDMDSKGSKFTWANNRIGEEFVKKRLDRATCNVEWRVLYPTAEVLALEAIGSDHSPLLLSLRPMLTHRRKLFQFEPLWTEKPECGQIVKEVWHSPRWMGLPLAQKMKHVSTALSKWSKKTFLNSRKQILNLKGDLQQLVNAQNCPADNIQIKEIKDQIQKYWQQEEMYWGIRSRVNWLKWGDKNTKFFHATTIQRRQRNRITTLQNREGVWIRDYQQLKAMTVDYFRELYTSVGSRDFAPVLQQCPVTVTPEMNQAMNAEVSMEEVKKAVFHMGALKAPGPDGLSSLFYQTYWEDIKEDIHCSVQHFFAFGNLDPELNKTFITLIPKIPHPEKLEQFRPISLCNIAYKIFSKVLANRLKCFLPDLIAGEQSAFVENRQIQDNILIVQEVLHQMRIRERKRKFQAILKLDMKKAYDRVEWDFMEACLRHMGFEGRWVERVMECIKSVSFSIKINGEAQGFFQPTRGLRQGDPISPYLFILMANTLSMLMRKAAADGTIKGIKLNRHCPVLSHLLFADDSIFFLDGRVNECQNLALILNQYCLASGQEVNLNKSGIYFSRGCPQSLRINMAAELRVPILEKTGKYLGIPADWGGSKRHMFAWVLARVNAKLEGWKEKLISKAGKEILIKAVVQSLPQYAMSLFKIPCSICSAIEKRIAQFWWQTSEAKKGIHWKKWDVMKKRKEMGGMGFRDLLTFNRAMLGKQAWRLLQNPNALWCQVLKGLYFPNKSLWQAGKGANGSWGWQSILQGRDSIAESVIWKVGTGENILIRQDRWLTRGTIVGPANFNEPTTVAELIIKEENNWNEQILSSTFEEEVVSEILTIPLSVHSSQDRLVWLGAKNGQFSVKSAYFRNRIEQEQTCMRHPSTSYQVSGASWKRMWQLNIPPRARNFLWLLCQNALPTRDNLFKRKIIPEPVCPICNATAETSEHLFLLCPWTNCVWSNPQLQLQISPIGLSRMEIWLQDYLSCSKTLPLLELVVLVLWNIWKARNHFIFRHQQPNSRDLVEEASVQLKNHQLWNMKQSKAKTGSTDLHATWVPPTAHTLKWNVDGAFVEGELHGYIAGVLRDSSGVVLDGFARRVPAVSALQTETLALLEALSLLAKSAADRLEEAVEVHSDCSVLVDAVFDPTLSPWQLRDQIEEAGKLVGSLTQIRLAHCRRESNMVADWLAKSLRQGLLSKNWLVYPPKHMWALLCVDTAHVDTAT